MTASTTRLAAPSATAEHVRRERARLVASVTDGSLDLAELSPGSAADLVKVVVLAQAVPGVGKVRSRRVLDALGVIPEARWGDMTAPLQARVVAALAESQRVVHDEQAGGKA